MKTLFRILGAGVFVFLLQGFLLFADVETYQIDSEHSSLTFKIRHFFSKAEGAFHTFSGTITVHPENMELNEVSAEIDVSSIDTQVKARDKDLRSPNYFDIEKFPIILFTSKTWKKIGENEFDVAGDLTLHGITKEVLLRVKFLGFTKGANDVSVSQWEAYSTLSKSRFGMTKSGKMLGDDVDISMKIEAGKSR
jgi:polyisoprenoid-binding protein YceI